ncbi:hypothetical protein [Actinophytocola sp.]|uniref:hypothetical protein n=1 Tax=Actinophytocola sp. TaxID=1872138 RepID=UPI00389ABA23
MAFFVRPEALDAYAKLVERNGINLSLTNVHLAGESRLENTEGLWIQHLLDAHTQTVDRMLTSLSQGFNQMGASADELARTAASYPLGRPGPGGEPGQRLPRLAPPAGRRTRTRELAAAG